MITISKDDEFEHHEHGLVIVQEIIESLDEAYITITDSGPVFDGGSVDETYVRFYSKKAGLEGTEEFFEFCENVSLFDES